MKGVRFLWMMGMFTMMARAQTQTDAPRARDVDSNDLTVLISGATPSVINGTQFKTNNANSTTITNFLEGVDSQRIVVICGDTNTSISNNANISLAVGAKFTCALNASIQFVFSARSSTWMQSSPTTGGSLPAALALPDPSSNETVCYAAPWGFDKNSGLSWGTARNSIMSCYDSLNINQGGNIFVTDAGINNPVKACTASDLANCGIWVMGGTDPNYKNPPPGWRKKLKPISIQGVGGSCVPTNGHLPEVCVAAGGHQDNTHPDVWVSGIAGGLSFYNLAFSYTARSIVLGIDSNNNRDGRGGSSDITLFNVSTIGWNAAGAGPSLDIGSNTFWIWIRDCLFGNINVIEPSTADNRANILIDPGSGDGSGLIYVEDTNLNNGGVKIKTGRSPTINIVVRNVTEEGDYMHSIPPAVWVTNIGACTSNQILVDNVSIADPGPNPPPNVQNDCVGGSPDALVLLQENSQMPVGGPATIIGGYSLGANSSTRSAISQGQQGFLNGHVIGQHDSARRSFAPTAVRFTNLAAQQPSRWTITQFGGGTSTLTKDVAAPDGTNNAARASNVGGTTQNSIIFYSANSALSPGDYLIGGAWTRSQTANGYSGSPNLGIAITFQVCTPDANTTRGVGEEAGDGNWQWQWQVKKITGGVKIGNCMISFSGNFDSTHAIEIYAPVFFRIPARTISDNEAYEVALNLQSYADTALTGDVSMLRGQRLSMSLPGSNYFIKHTGSLTADRTVKWQDASGTVSETIASGVAMLGRSAIDSNSCAKMVSVMASGVATTDSISWSFQADPTGITGYGAGSNGALSIWAFPTNNSVNFRVCNLTARSITPDPVTLNWRVVR